MTLIHIHAEHPRPTRLLSRLQALISIRQQRRILARLSDHELRDIGLTRAQAMEESRRAFWDASEHWRL